MKKVLLLITAAGFSVAGFAQKSAGHVTLSPRQANGVAFHSTSISTGRTTAIGDTTVLDNMSSSDTLTLYQVTSSTDSGYITGTDAYGDKGYAERYDFNGADSSIVVLGVLTEFSGHINPANTTPTATFYAWDQAAKSYLIDASRPNLWNSGLPGAVLASSTARTFNTLGVGTGTDGDTARAFMFTTPTANLSSSFFVGCVLNYNFTSLNGDTIGILTNKIGERVGPYYNVVSGDTLIDNVSVSQYSDGSWNDNWASNFGAAYDFLLLPIVAIEAPTAVKNVVRNGLTFYGNYPNPASASTTVKFALAASGSVTITVMDMNGRTLNAISEKGLSAGEHTIEIPVSGLASGEYLYSIRTSAGDGIASKFTVAK